MVTDRMVPLKDLSLHIRDWQPAAPKTDAPFFLLVHGLSSNARTWDMVAEQLNAAGYRAVAVDQRGHGLSDKPDHGYDFETISGDLYQLIQVLGFERLVIAGQSWGGNVLLDFGVRYPHAAEQLIFVDGGFLHLNGRGTWEQISKELRPPELDGLPRQLLEKGIADSHPLWAPAGIEATLENMETLPDGTVRRRLSIDNHMKILRAMYEQPTPDLYPRLNEPVLICVALDGSAWAEQKKVQVSAAAAMIPEAKVVWFEHTAHDIHVERPTDLAQEMLSFITQHPAPQR